MNLYTEGSEFRIGFDVVSVSRIASILQDHPEAFRCYAFTDAEQKYCEDQYYPPENYAVRWAIKEAYIKAVNTQERTPDLTSIEIKPEPIPHLSVTGDGLEMLSNATEQRNTVPEKVSVDVSLTHERKIDTACGLVMILF